MAKSEEELKSLLTKVKEESEKAGLKLNIQKTKIMASSSITSWQPMRKQWKQWQTLFSWTPKSLQMVTTALKWNHLLLRRKAMTNLDSILKSRDINLPTKVHLDKAMVFSSSHVWTWELDYKESWALKNWCFWTMALEKTLGSPFDCKEIKPVHPKGNQSWIFTEGTDAEAEAPILWPPDLKNWSLEKILKLGKIECGRRRGWQRMRWLVLISEDEMIGWHHRLDRHEFEQAPGVGDGQRSLACCSPWGHKGSDTT